LKGIVIMGLQLSNTLISIVVPVYNVEPYIRKTFESVIRQTSKDYELIIVDDGSTDNSFKEIQRIVTTVKTGNIHVIRKQNGGVSSARNCGLLQAKGDYILFLDGDDYIKENCVEVLCEHIKKNRSDIICYGMDQVSEKFEVLYPFFDRYKLPDKPMTGIDTVVTLIKGQFFQIWTGSAVYRRDFLSRHSLHYNEKCHSGQDSEFSMKALISADKVSFINRVLSFYLIREGSKTNRYNIERFQVIYARKRVLEYARARMNKKTFKIFETKISSNIIRRYIYVFISCLEYKIGQSKTKREAIKTLNTDIDTQLPGLRKEIDGRIKLHSYTGRNYRKMKFLIKAKLFGFSPSLYYTLTKINPRPQL
jgi:glycosyltransferase involved in cell wall biosynthesis